MKFHISNSRTLELWNFQTFKKQSPGFAKLHFFKLIVEMSILASRVVWFTLGFGAAIAVVLNAIVLISSSTDVGVVKHLNWSNAHQKVCGNDCINQYVGFWNIVVESGSARDKSVYWDTAVCYNSNNYCQKCESTMRAVLAVTTVSLAFAVPSIYTNFARASDSGNSVSHQVIGSVTSLIAMCGAIAAVISFANSCQRNIYLETKNDFDWYYGSAWIMMIVVSILNAASGVANLVIFPHTPPARDFSAQPSAQPAAQLTSQPAADADTSQA